MNDLITAEEVSRILKVRISTVYAAARRGQLPAVRLWTGQRRTLLRFRRGEIERWLRDRSSAPRG